jgi:hypothetical protein
MNQPFVLIQNMQRLGVVFGHVWPVSSSSHPHSLLTCSPTSGGDISGSSGGSGSATIGATGDLLRYYGLARYPFAQLVMVFKTRTYMYHT